MAGKAPIILFECLASNPLYKGYAIKIFIEIRTFIHMTMNQKLISLMFEELMETIARVQDTTRTAQIKKTVRTTITPLRVWTVFHYIDLEKLVLDQVGLLTLSILLECL